MKGTLFLYLVLALVPPAVAVVWLPAWTAVADAAIPIPSTIATHARCTPFTLVLIAALLARAVGALDERLRTAMNGSRRGAIPL